MAGEWDVPGLMGRMPASLFELWAAYYAADPWGRDRADLRAGIVASTVANAFRGKGQAAFKAKDFMPTFGPRRPQTAAEMSLAMMTFAATFGGGPAKPVQGVDEPQG